MPRPGWRASDEDCMTHSLPSILAVGWMGLASALAVAPSAIADDTESSTDLPLEEFVQGVRVAGVSAFGFGGTNGTLVFRRLDG